MASQYALNKHKSAREIEKQAKMEDCFGAAWCHVGIFGSGENTNNWCFILALYNLDDFLMI